MKKLLLIILFLSYLPVYAVNEIDSLENVVATAGEADRLTALTTLADEYLFVAPQRSFQLSTAALDIAIRQKNIPQEGKAFQIIGSTYLITNHNDSALVYLNKALEVYKQISDTLKMAFITRALGDAYNNLANYSKAQESYYFSLYLYDNYKNKYDVQYLKSFTTLLNNFGAFYMNLENYGEAIKYFERASDSFGRQSKKQGQALAFYNIGLCYDKIHNEQQALHYYGKACLLAKDNANSNVLANSLLGIGNIYYAKKDYDKALSNYEQSEPLFENIEDNLGLYHANTSIGNCLIEKKKYQQALKYFKSAKEYAATLNTPKFTMATYQSLTDVYAKLGDFKESYKYVIELVKLKDSVASIDKLKQIQDLDRKFSLEKQEKENQALRSLNVVAELNKSRLTSVIFSLIFVIGLISLLAYELYRRNAERTQLNDMLSEKNKQIEVNNTELVQLNATKDKFFSIIAHDLRNPLGSFKALSEMLAEKFDDFSNEEKLEFINSLNTSSKSLFELLENLLDWSRSQRNTIDYTPEDLQINMLLEYYLQTLKNAAKEKNIIIVFDIPDNTIIFADQYLISTVFKNLVSNAIKYTPFGGKVIISAQEKSSYIEFSVADNGVGMQADKIAKLFKIDEKVVTLGTEGETGAGLGLILCKEFVQKHGGEIWIESEENVGSTFYFSLPKKSESSDI